MGIIDPTEQIAALEKEIDQYREKINHQKAAIERLQSINNFLKIEYKNQGNLFLERVNDAKSEAIREFAERLKEDPVCDSKGDRIVYVDDIDDLVKEMTEEES